MSKVVVVKYYRDARGSGLTRDEYRRLMSVGLHRLTGESDMQKAVRKLIPPGVIGMKTNCLTGKLNSTPVALIDALGDCLDEAGVDDNDMVVWERTSRELAGAGYTLNASGSSRRCLGTDANRIGYSQGFYSSGEVNSLVSRILTDLVDHNINVPVLKDHSIAGLSAGMKNMYGAINNPNKYHGDNCNPFCAHVSALEPVRAKNRLTVIDAVRVQYNGGPGFMSQFLTYYNGVIISDDPAAADRVGLQVLENLRKANGQPPLEKVGRPVKYLVAAGQLGLGEVELSRIEVDVVVVDEDGRPTAGELF
ncbi:MAG: DUF362 domain-containing protein [candidate division Zixibacteria bacterium]|nr:DUF362 domain-containing protein [candidate division Zixibacteria bacterium]